VRICFTLELPSRDWNCLYRYDLATASDIKYYALPDLQSRLQQLEQKKAAEDAAEGGSADSVTPEQIADIVARWTNIPVTRLMSSEKEKLLRMEKILSASVVGQTEAVKSVANAIRLSRSGLANPQRPIASFLMAGPSGTGKTLLAKTVSQHTLQGIMSFTHKFLACDSSF
jgi:ATP-dependent Clp protease ATP-binding subunit ClpB